jgi:hypothetical protein
MNGFTIPQQYDPEILAYLIYIPPFPYPSVGLNGGLDRIVNSLKNPFFLYSGPVRSLPHEKEILSESHDFIIACPRESCNISAICLVPENGSAPKRLKIVCVQIIWQFRISNRRQWWLSLFLSGTTKPDKSQNEGCPYGLLPAAFSV